jgi:transcriptional regulator with XRE-family HTH domain
LRERAGLSGRALSLAAGLTPSHVKLIEGGIIRSPHLDTIIRIAKALGVPLEELAESPRRKVSASARKSARVASQKNAAA